MRSIITISLPPSIEDRVRNAVKEGEFGSMSEYFRHVLREYERSRLAAELKKDRKTFKTKGAKVLRSLKHLR